ncbi:unnamed protein product, partial [Meganyctiphanes norvegica]
ISTQASSSYNGWNVAVFQGCQNNIHQRNCTNGPLFQDGLWLEDEEATERAAKPKYRDGEGLVMMVFNQHNGMLIFKKLFPLNKYYAHWYDLHWHISRVSVGRVVILTIMVSGTGGIRHAATTLSNLGSLFVKHLTTQAHWTWTFIQGGKTLSESVVMEGRAKHQIHSITNTDLYTKDPILSRKEEQRSQFCQNHGCMGGLCDPNHPDVVPPPEAQSLATKKHVLDNVPIIVSAGTRIQYLYYTLSKLLSAPGAKKRNILVILGDTTNSTITLLNILEVNYTFAKVNNMKTDSQVNNNMPPQNQMLFSYYRYVYKLVLDTFPLAEATIFLDEDVEVSPDFFSYMSQTIWLLKNDSSLYCINGFSQLGMEGSAHNPSRLLRGRVQVSWGYAITTDFIREVLPLWPQNGTTDLYDYWLYNNVRRDRECVFPEFSRTRHYGVGVNSVSKLSENYFISMPTVQEAKIPLPDVPNLVLSEWRKDLTHSIRNSTYLKGNPCTKDFLPLPSKPTNYTFCYRHDSTKSEYHNQFEMVAKCLHAFYFSLNRVGMHEGVQIFSYAPGVQVFLIGSPLSSYSHLCPPKRHLFDELALSTVEWTQNTEYAMAIDVPGIMAISKFYKITKPDPNNTISYDFMKLFLEG